MQIQRFRIQTMMAIVALTALSIRGGITVATLYRRSLTFQEFARLQEVEEINARERKRIARSGGPWPLSMMGYLMRCRPVPHELIVDWCEQQASYHGELRVRYESVARAPWRETPAIPPEPRRPF